MLNTLSRRAVICQSVAEVSEVTLNYIQDIRIQIKKTHIQICSWV